MRYEDSDQVHRMPPLRGPCGHDMWTRGCLLSTSNNNDVVIWINVSFYAHCWTFFPVVYRKFLARIKTSTSPEEII